MKLTAPVNQTSITARHLNITLLMTLVICFGLTLGTINWLAGMAVFSIGLLFLYFWRSHLSNWNLVQEAAYPILSLALVAIDGLSLQESGLSYVYPALYLHLLITRNFGRSVHVLLAFGVLCLAVQLWQPFTAFAIVEAPQTNVFIVTLTGVMSAFLLSVIYLKQLRSERESLAHQVYGLSAHLEQLNQANILLMTTDLSGSVSFINEAAKKVFFPEGCSEITLPADFLACIQETSQTGQLTELEFTKSASRCRLHFHKNPDPGVVNISGELIKDCANSTSKHVLEAVSERIPAGLFILDNALQTVYTNAVARSLLCQETLGSSQVPSLWMTALSARDSGRLRNEVLPSIKQKGAWAGVVEFKAASGQRFKRILHLYRTNQGMIYGLIIDHTDLAFAPGFVDELVLKELADEKKIRKSKAVHQKPEETKKAAGFSPPPAVNQIIQATSQPRVLVADDDEINREIAAYLLKRVGVQPEFAKNGKEAVDQHERSAYDIIILDLNMPIMGGLEAARLISARQGVKPLLVATTANHLPVIEGEIAEVGFEEILPKPFKPEKIAEILKNWERQHHLRCA